MTTRQITYHKIRKKLSFEQLLSKLCRKEQARESHTVIKNKQLKLESFFQFSPLKMERDPKMLLTDGTSKCVSQKQKTMQAGRLLLKSSKIISIRSVNV
jgi:hypothetical protein